MEEDAFKLLATLTHVAVEISRSAAEAAKNCS